MTPKERAKSLILDIAYDIVGAFMYAVGIHSFLSPNHIAPGGVSGLSVLVNYLTGWPLGVLVLVLNIPLLLLAARFLGMSFTLKTLKTVAIMTVMLDVVMPLWLPVYEGNPILAALFGGVAMGAGMGIVFMRGSTTGGSDIASRLIQLRFPYMQIGRVLLLVDVVVLALAAIVYRNIETALYGMISLFTGSRIIDSLLYGLDTGQLCFVISEKNREIADEVMKQLDRGVTLLHGEGAYRGDGKKVLMCAVRKQQSYRLRAIIHEIDPTAFMIAADAGEILGHGFRPLGRDIH